MNIKHPKAGSHVSRRSFLKLGAAGVGGALVAGTACSSGSESKEAAAPEPGATPQAAAIKTDGPEVTDVRFGMIALTDCSPIVIAHEKGMFKKYGINSTVVKGASWAAT